MSEMELNQLIGKNILRLLESKNRTRAELAEYMGVTEATISNWCNGKKPPRTVKIDKICIFFGVERSEIIGSESSGRPKSELLEKIDKLGPEYIPLLTAYADLLLASKEKQNP